MKTRCSAVAIRPRGPLDIFFHKNIDENTNIYFRLEDIEQLDQKSRGRQ